MFRSIWRKTLRDYRVAILSWGIGAGLVITAVFATATPALRDAYASIAQSFRFFGDAFAVRTPEGYATTRLTELILPLLLCIWPILAGADLVRGEEERGTLDVVLATPQSRRRIILEKLLALVLALILLAVLVALGTIAGELGSGTRVDFLRALFTALNMSLLAFFFAMGAFLFSQFTRTQGAAARYASGLMILAFLLDGTGRTIEGTWVHYLSPLYYYNLNRPLIPSFRDAPMGALLLFSLSLVCATISVVLFARRDIGSPVFFWQRIQTNPHQPPGRSPRKTGLPISLRTVGLRAVCAQGWSSFWWLLSMVIYTAWCVLLIPSIQKPLTKALQQSPELAKSLSASQLATIPIFLSVIVFFLLPVLVVIFALTLALTWAGDLDKGHLELVLSTPQSRRRILLERFGAIFLLILLAPVLIWLTLITSLHLAHLSVEQSNILAASFSMLPPALVVMSLVYALAGRLRSGAVRGIVTIYIFLAFLVEFLQGLFHLPGWIMSLSIFYQYGNPIVDGINWRSFLGMASVSLVLLVLALVQFSSGDIERG